MRIAFDGRILARPHTGINTYLVNLVQALAHQGRHELVILSDRPPLPEAADLASVARIVVFGERCRRWWPHHVLSWYLRKHPVDLYHAVADDGVPMWAPCPSVLTLHDLVPLVHKRHFRRWKKRLWYRISHAIERRIVRLIMTDSEFMRQSILQYFPSLAAKLRVVPLGIDESFRPLVLTERHRQLLARYGVNYRPFILSVPSRLLEPRKNVKGLLEAYVKLRKLFDGPIDLVVLGSDLGNFQGRLGLFGRCPAQWQTNIHVLEHVAQEVMPVLYCAARVLLYPSLLEGFGLPILEAMACGTPVVASNASCLPEVAQEAAVLVDPTDSDAMSQALARVLNDEAWHRELVARGLAHVRRFSWQRTAQTVASLYEEAVVKERV